MNLDADSSDTEDTVKENIVDPKKMSGENKDSPNESLTDQPTLEQIAFENRLIAKFSELMSEQLKPLENSIKELMECQRLHSNSIKEISHMQEENIKLKRQIEGMSKENTSL